MMFKFLLTVLMITVSQVSADCWDTGCQLNSWAVRGCGQYNMVETGQRGCPNGIIYSCCSSGAPAPAPGPAPAPSTDGSIKYGDATYYNLGMTACGQAYQDTDYVAAIAFSYWTTPNPNLDPMCGKLVRVTDPTSGKSVQVRIRDKCGGCQAEDIDMSPTAFQTLRPLGTGRFKVKWSFI